MEIFIINNSCSPLGYSSGGLKLQIPGHCFAQNPMRADVPAEKIEALREYVETGRPHMKVVTIEELQDFLEDLRLQGIAKAQAVPGSAGDAGSGGAGSGDAGSGDAGGEKTGETGNPNVPPQPPVPMDKDEFFAACKASKVEDAEDTWDVTVPDGRVLRIAESNHHKKAKQAAYEQVYGGGDQ